jgi:hypothetical protein
MENIENQLLNRLQKTQKREADIFNSLELAIRESINSHKERLDFKMKKNENIRSNYKLPPTFTHLEGVMNTSSVSVQ